MRQQKGVSKPHFFASKLGCAWRVYPTVRSNIVGENQEWKLAQFALFVRFS
jgi:hypothetical protein